MVKFKGKFYITTAIDYPNTAPHLGQAYEKICADSIARWHRLQGEEVFFLTGTDEHGLKIQRAAEAAKQSPKEFVDAQALHFRALCEKLNISNDRFIRTTDPEHIKVSQEIFRKVFDSGDIYKGFYEGLYCASCENYITEKELINGKCPYHGKAPELLREESYFFRLSKYQSQIIKHIRENSEFIQPEGKRTEILNRLKEPLKDLSVSRSSFHWGIPLPNDSKHIQYVWFDALLNYVSGIDYPQEKFKKFWPCDLHNIGKDILWFHAVIWPAILLSANIELPKRIFVHSFINLASGEKMSKSLGNAVDPISLANTYGADALRYFLLREIPFGQDGIFSEELLKKRYNTELANELGNLLQRTLVLIEKNCNGKIPEGQTDNALAKKLNLEKIKSHMGKLELHFALGEIFSFIAHCNAYVNEKQPWKLSGAELNNVLYSLADSLRITAILLQPFIPETAEKISSQLGIKLGNLEDCRFGLLRAGTKTNKAEILFRKI